MRPTPPQLVSFDVTDTLARIQGMSHIKLVCAISPLPPAQVRQVLTHQLRLKTLPSVEALTESMIEQACQALRIRRQQWPFASVPPAPYRLMPDARQAVARIAALLPVVALTNTSVFADAALEPVRQGLWPHLLAVHTSWQTGVAKPDPLAFHAATQAHGVSVDQLVHVGNNWDEDIAPLLRLGGRAVWLTAPGTPTQAATSAAASAGTDRLALASTLTDAVDQITARWLSAR